MKKLIFLMVIPLLMVSCFMSEAEKEEVIQEVKTIINEPGEEEPEPLIFESCDVSPIPEDADFYFFTDGKTLWKYNLQVSESIQIDGVIHYENAEDQAVQFRPHEFFSRDGYYFYSWFIRDYYYDEEGELVPQLIKYYKQNNNIIEEIDKYEFGHVPQEYYGTYLSANFSLEIHEFEGYPINKLFNLAKSGSAVYEKIYEVYENINGIFFNVLIGGDPTLQEGLYYFPVDRTSSSRVRDKGRLWIK